MLDDLGESQGHKGFLWGGCPQTAGLIILINPILRAGRMEQG